MRGLTREPPDWADIHRECDQFIGCLLHAAFKEYLEIERDRDTGYLDTPKRRDAERSNSQIQFDMGARQAFNHAIIAFEKVRKLASESLARHARASRGRKED